MARFRLLAVAAAAVVVALLLPASPALAATTSQSTNEWGGSGVTARSNTEALKSAWLTAVATAGGTAQAPTILPSGPISGVISTATDGTTTSVARTRYTTGSTTTYVGPSPNPGTGNCVANGATAGAGLQGGAPRPTSLVGGSAACPNGFSYSEFGGTGENTTRDAVEFTFSRPVLGFGAWFGDLETRTDGQGVPALVRLFGPGDVLLSEQQVEPGPNYLPQSNCGGTFTGCGNNTTRWIGFVADPAQPVIRMVVIVGDDDPCCDGSDEGMGFIGPSLVLNTATLSIAKSAAPLADTSADGIVGPGDTISYSMLVTNTGTVAATALAVTDPNATGLTCPSNSLAAGASVTCTATHVITQTEADAGTVVNTASATATAFGGTIAAAPSTVTTTIPPIAGLAIEKSVDAATYSAVGDVLNYDVLVTNVGNQTLRNVVIQDPAPGAGGFTTDCDAVSATLGAGATTTCTASYTVTQADIDAGTVINTASTTGLTPSDSPLGLISDSAVSTAEQVRNLTLTKTVDEPLFTAVGDQLHFHITARNNGNVTLSSLAIEDAAPGAGAFTTDCDTVATSLAPAAEATCDATYTVTQEDLDAGLVTNSASAAAQDPAGTEVAAPPAAATSNAVVTGGLGLAKVVAEGTYDAVGQVLNYTLTVTNLGTVTLSNLAIVDPSPGSGAFTSTCGAIATTLAPRQSRQCTAQYTVTQTDIDSGSVSNTAVATARTPAAATVTSNDAGATSTAVVLESLGLTKVAAETTYSAVGDVIHYTVTATNTGNTTLQDAVIADPAPGGGAFTTTCGTTAGGLAPGGSVVCTSEYTITQTDIDQGGILNTASASATGVTDATITAADSSVATPATQVFSLVLDKTVDRAEFDAVGQVLTYTLTLSSLGNTTVTQATIADASPGDGSFSSDCPAVSATLVPGGQVSCTATYTVTQADLDAGAVDNSATATALDPQSNTRDANTATATSAAVQSPSLTFVKTSDETTFAEAGDAVHFTMTLTNTGNVSFESTWIADSAPGAGAFTSSCGDLAEVLAPGATRTCTATYIVDAEDVALRGITNAASGSAIVMGGAVSVPAVLSEVSLVQRDNVLPVTGAVGPTVLALLAGALFFAGLALFAASRRRRASPSGIRRRG